MVLHYIFTAFCVIAGFILLRGAHIVHKNKMSGDSIMGLLALIAFIAAAGFYFTA